MIYTQNISLDVAREQTLYINAKQYDSNSRFLEVTILAQGQPQAVAAGSAVTINARRPDGSAQSFAGTVVGGLVKVPVDSWILEQYGTVYCSISVVDSNTAKITTLSFRLIVERSEGNGWILVYTAPSALSAGTYYITLSGINYQFTTTQTVPVGGKIYFSSTYATGKTVGTSDIETLTLTVGSSGTQLVGSDVINFLASFMANIAELGNKADKVGESPDLVAGTAEQIIGEEFTENKVPYSFRQTPGSGKRLDEEVVGATVAWDQLVKDGNFPTGSMEWSASASTMVVADGEAILTADSSNRALALYQDFLHAPYTGHKFIYAFDAKSADIHTIRLRSPYQTGNFTLSANYQTYTGIIIPNEDMIRIQGVKELATDPGTLYIRNFIIIDLTIALGQPIADYLYTLESNTPGAGVAKFRELFPADYYAYCEPTLQSVCVSKHIEANSDNTEVNEYPLEAVELRGVLRLDSDNNIYADGDTYEGDGTVTRRYGVVDLGQRSWSKQNEAGFYTFYTTGAFSNAKATAVVCQKYVYSGVNNHASLAEGQICWFNNTDKQITVRDTTYADAAAFKTAMSGVYLVYELATPTTESADPYPSLQHCSGGGTEEYVDYLVGQGTRDVSIPAGHNSKYYPDLTQRISDIPEPPSGDGTYTLQCTVSSGVRTFAWV